MAAYGFDDAAMRSASLIAVRLLGCCVALLPYSSNLSRTRNCRMQGDDRCLRERMLRQHECWLRLTARRIQGIASRFEPFDRFALVVPAVTSVELRQANERLWRKKGGNRSSFSS